MQSSCSNCRWWEGLHRDTNECLHEANNQGIARTLTSRTYCCTHHESVVTSEVQAIMQNVDMSDAAKVCAIEQLLREYEQ